MPWWEIARTQGGVITLRQLRDSGLSRDRVDGLIRRGELVAVLPRVYRAAATPLTVEGRRFAAVLWSDGAISHFTAADVRDLGQSPAGDTVDVSVMDRRSRNGHPSFVRVHRVLLGPGDVECVGGLPVTSLSRTTLDVVGTLSRRPARTLFERGFQQGWFSLEDLDRRLEREKGRSGNVALREFREEITPGAQSEFERRFHRLLAQHGITGWEPQFTIHTATGGLVKVDIAFPAHKLIVELDGWSTHGGRQRFGADRKRDRRNLVTGWNTVRYVWGDLDTPNEIIDEILCLLAA